MTDLIKRLRALQATLAQMTDSEFAVACSGEFCEDFKNTIEGCIANGLDRIEQLEAEIARKDETLSFAYSWLDRWATHIGMCQGGQVCMCGLTRLRFDITAALETKHD